MKFNKCSINLSHTLEWKAYFEPENLFHVPSFHLESGYW